MLHASGSYAATAEPEDSDGSFTNPKSKMQRYADPFAWLSCLNHSQMLDLKLYGYPIPLTESVEGALDKSDGLDYR